VDIDTEELTYVKLTVENLTTLIRLIKEADKLEEIEYKKFTKNK